MTADELKAWRKRSGMTQRSLANELGIHWRTVQEYEAGRLRVTKLVELALQSIERAS